MVISYNMGKEDNKPAATGSGKSKEEDNPQASTPKGAFEENTPQDNILLSNILEYFNAALKHKHSKKYNSAVTLFFKAIAALGDLFLLRNEKKIPNSHTKRFLILKNKYQEIYLILDRDFPFYQDSYTNKMNLEETELLENDARELAKKLNLKL